MKKLISLVWWPHSGGRWLSRSILKNNKNVFQTTFVNPWIFNSTDDILSLDITSQVHKARSLPELKQNLEALYHSVQYGRTLGLSKYFEMIEKEYDIPIDKNVIIGEVCLGSPKPKPIDLNTLFESRPNMKIIHLVRNPIESYSSFQNRYEMDCNPILIAGSWVSLNANIRNYIVENELNSQYHLIRYEDLIRNPEHEIKKLCNFCEIEFSDSMILKLEERWGKKSFKKTNELDIEKITSIAKTEMALYGYK